MPRPGCAVVLHFAMRNTTSGVSRDDGRSGPQGPDHCRPGDGLVDVPFPSAPWAFWPALLILIAVTLLTMPGNPVLDLNAPSIARPATHRLAPGRAALPVRPAAGSAARLAAVAALSPARASRSSAPPRWFRSGPRPHLAGVARVRAGAHPRVGASSSPPRTLYLTAAWIAGRHAACSARGRRRALLPFVAVFWGVLALEEMDWLGWSADRRPIGSDNVYLGPPTICSRWPGTSRFAIPRPLRPARRGHALVRAATSRSLIRREMFDPTTLPLYTARLVAPGGRRRPRRGRLDPERDHPSSATAGGAIELLVRAPPGDAAAAQVLPRLAPGGPPPVCVGGGL